MAKVYLLWGLIPPSVLKDTCELELFFYKRQKKDWCKGYNNYF